MPHADFVPKGEADFSSWHTQLKNSAEELAAVIGIPESDIAMLAADNVDFRESLSEAALAAAAAVNATKRKKASRSRAERNARAFARRVKELAGFSPGHAAQMGIDGSGKAAVSLETQAAAEAKPELRGKAVITGAEIKFTKKRAEAVNLYSKYEGDAGFVLLGRYSYSPIKDSRPARQAGVPEKRLYMAVYVSHDTEYGQRSSIITVVCGG
jgi:hypothetical protein